MPHVQAIRRNNDFGRASGSLPTSPNQQSKVLPVRSRCVAGKKGAFFPIQ